MASTDRHGRHRAHRRGGQRRAVPSGVPRLVRFMALAGALLITVVAIAGWVRVDRATEARSRPNPEPVVPSSAPSPTAADVPAPARSSELGSLSRPAAQPSSVAIPEAGSGRLVVASGGRPTGRDGQVSYRVEVERELPFAARAVARAVEATLSDPRGWGVDGRHDLVRVDGSSDLRIVLVTPHTADELCAPLDTGGRLSCRKGAYVVINAWRWRHGAPGYRGNLPGYRRYVVNHEVGHALGYPHTPCPEPGALAPVMLQQTLGLDGCRPNPWPDAVDLAP